MATSTTVDGVKGAAGEEEVRVAADHFGGPFGAAVLTFVLPTITYYLWATISQHGGNLWLPRTLDDVRAMFPAPTMRAVAIYGAWLALHALLYVVAPGKTVEGATLRDGTRLPYKMNGLLAFVVSIATIVALLATKTIRATEILAELGPMITVSTLMIAAFSVWFYFWGRARGMRERSSGILVYDFFMGTVLNPRLGRFDFKFFFESRMGMGSWGALAVLLAAAELERTGTLSTPMIVVSVCQLWYITDFFVFESNLLSMLDIIYENFGFMLAYGCVVWIPFNFTLQQQFLLENPRSLPVWAVVAIVVFNFCGYVIFRDSNLQKQRFRRDPSRPVWGKPPKVLKTKRGTQLLLSGWWGLSRHANYLGDLMMALSWCLTCGFTHVIPYFYFIYFAPLLINRERRDHALCKEKYGADWDEYCKRVPSRIIPGIY
jgi:protein-S-isoprenylcysteine O-methyltransferase Ste14